MGKTPVDIIKYVIHAEAEAKGLVEKPDIIGAIFGQTEGLLGEDLDLRELQKSGRIGRIEADTETKSGVTKALISIPSSLDMVETSIIAASVETITRIGPCEASFKIKAIEDVRKAKRDVVVDRASEILKQLLDKEIPDAKEIAEEVRHEVMGNDIVKYLGFDAGPAVETSESVILVEGRADVINLLRNGVKNAVAIGGINVSKEIVDLCNSKTSTVFVDGDRGGDLILKSLEKAGAKIDFVAKAPKNLEVENLARKEIMMALRRKVEATQAFGEFKEQQLDSSEEMGHREHRDHREHRSRSSSGSPPRYGSSERRGPSRYGSSERRGPSRYGSSERRGPSKYRPEESAPEPSNTPQSILLNQLSTTKNEAALLDSEFKVVKKIPLVSLGKEKIEGHALVIDDVVTQKIVDNTKVKFIAAITKANNLKAPNVEIFTKF